MIIENLYLKNFMSINEARFSFSPEEEIMILLKGGNGSGKSSVFHAIAFAMLGLRKGSSAKNFIKRGETSFQITMQIRKRPNSDPYHINIVCGKKTMPPVSKVISYQGHEYKNSEYETFIKKEFDIPLLEAIVFTMQGDNDITNFKPSQLREMLKQVFHISFEQEHDIIVKTAHQLSDRSQTINNNIASYKHSLTILDDGVANELLQRPPSKAILDARTLELEKLTSRLLFIQKDTLALKTLEEAIANKTKELERVTASVKQVVKEYEEAQTDLSSKTTARTLLLKTSEEIKKQLEKNPKQELESLLDKQAKSKTKLQISLSEINRKIDVSKADVCYTCGQKLPADWVNHKEDFPVILSDLKKQLKELASDNLSIKKKIDEWNGKENTALRIAFEITSLNQQIKDIQKTIDYKITSEYYSELLDTQKVLEKEIKNLNTSWEASPSLRRELDEEDKLNKEIAIKKTELNKLEQQLTSYEAQKKIKKSIAEKKINLKSELDKLSLQLVNIDEEKTTYQAAQRLVEKYLPTFGILIAGEKVIDSMSKIIQPIFPNWKMRLVPCRDGVDFEYKSEGEDEYSSISMASGFESALCSIAFKLALTAYYQFPVLILDEIDEASEDKNSYLLFDSMTSFKKEYNIQQIWIVSHKEGVVNKLVSEYGDMCQVYKADKGAFTREYDNV